MIMALDEHATMDTMSDYERELYIHISDCEDPDCGCGAGEWRTRGLDVGRPQK